MAADLTMYQKVKCPAFVLCLAFILCISTGVGAAPTDSSNYWLLDPCSQQYPIVTTPSLRHHRAIDPATTQFNIFMSKLKHAFTKDLKSLYPDFPLQKPSTNVNGKCLKINKMVNIIARPKTTEVQAKKSFYQQLVHLGIFFDKYMKIEIQSSSPNKDREPKRLKLLQATKDNMRLLMCEFKTTLKIEESLIDKWINQPKRQVSTDCLPKTFDLTTAQISDIDLYHKLRKFFSKSKRVLMKKKRNGRKIRRARKQRRN